MKKIVILSVFILAFTVLNAAEEDAITLNASFTGDFFQNFNGGIKTGNTSLGLMNMMLALNTENAGLWKNGIFFVNAQSLFGGKPTSNYIGDIQVASNIEGLTNRFIYEAWYKQELGDFSILMGLHNLNSEFFVSNNGVLYLNSTFGTGAFLSLNHYVSIYPVTTLGTIARFDKEQISFLAGIYNHGNNFVEEENFQWENHLFNQGYIAIAELQIRSESWRGEYKFGTTFRKCTDDDLLNKTIFLKEKNYGVYFIADQNIVNMENKSFSAFTQVGFNDFVSNLSPLLLTFGLNSKGIFTGSENEELGLAYIHARINKLTDGPKYVFSGTESVFELSSKFSINDNIALHPDVQYIINPSGTNELKNALIGILRLEMSF